MLIIGGGKSYATCIWDDDNKLMNRVSKLTITIDAEVMAIQAIVECIDDPIEKDDAGKIKTHTRVFQIKELVVAGAEIKPEEVLIDYSQKVL